MIPLLSTVACLHRLPSVDPETPAPRPPAPIVDTFPEATGTCGVFETFGETAAYPALGDRFRVTLPADTFAEGGAHNESRFVVTRGDASLVVMVYETYGQATDELADVVARNEQNPASVVRTTVAGLPAAVVEPTSTWGPPGGVLVGSGWYNSPDGTVVNVGVFATPDVAPTPDACREVARRVLTSVEPSDARLDLGGGERDVEGLRVWVPPGYAMTTERGEDAVVVQLFPIVPLEAPIPMLGLYLGLHPTFQPIGTPDPGELLGEPATWYASEQGGWVNASALQSAGDQLLHVYATAPDAAALAALVDIAETLRRAD